MNSDYTLKEVLFAVRHKPELLDRAAETGNFDLVDTVVDAEYIINHCGLTARQMDFFTLYYVQDFTLAMIADKYSISHQGVADNLAQCRKKLQKYIDREGE